MLNINVDISFNKKKERFPVHLIGENLCLHCGAKNTLKKMDIFGNESKQEIYPLDHIVCSRCGYEYSIKWTEDPQGSGKLIPVPVSRSIKQEAVNTMHYLNIRNNGESEI